MNTNMATTTGTYGGGLNPAPAQQGSNAIWGTPLDGRYLWDVIEEQIYSEQRPTLEEQRPRYSYLKDHSAEEPTRDTSPCASIGAED